MQSLLKRIRDRVKHINEISQQESADDSILLGDLNKELIVAIAYPVLSTHKDANPTE